MATVNERVTSLVAPVLADLGLSLYDLELGGGVLRVTIDRPGGVDLEAIAHATRLLSRELDHADPVPGRYTLEVTSPGLERALRTPAHFAGAVGATVAVRTHPEVEGDRRAQGVLLAADDEGITVRLDSEGEGQGAGELGAERRLRYDEIERARTVFVWGPAAGGGSPVKPGKSAKGGKPTKRTKPGAPSAPVADAPVEGARVEEKEAS